MNEPASYRCPGERYEISRSVHLGRLASFYPACRTCPHRDETGTLSAKRTKQIIAARGRGSSTDLFYQEGIAGVELNEIEPSMAHRAAVALADYLRAEDSAPANSEPPPCPAASAGCTIVIAYDGRPVTAELVAAAADGLRYGGCHVVDIGPQSAPCLARSIDALGAAGGFYLGNGPSLRHTVGLKFWSAGGRPLSAGAGLESVAKRMRDGVPRPTRRFGTLARFQPEDAYRSRLQSYFHGLRPLRIALDCRCQPMRRDLDQLAADVACQFLPPAAAREAPGGKTSVIHFHFWIDGDGEGCRVQDEQGQTIDGHRLLSMLAKHGLDQECDAIVIESRADAPQPRVSRKASPNLFQRERNSVEEVTFRPPLTASSAAAVEAIDSSRAAMDRAMRESCATIGGGNSGRIWFGHDPPLPDALETLARLLVILSKSDRPLSEVAASDIFGG